MRSTVSAGQMIHQSIPEVEKMIIEGVRYLFGIEKLE
tara:strand:+ start:59 stop:169 length:111 start_codon:yes stop_codon:yes gene_type:complete